MYTLLLFIYSLRNVAVGDKQTKLATHVTGHVSDLTLIWNEVRKERKTTSVR